MELYTAEEMSAYIKNIIDTEYDGNISSYARDRNISRQAVDAIILNISATYSNVARHHGFERVIMYRRKIDD